MLFDAANTRAVTSTLRAHFPDPATMPPLVVDPVSVSTSGHTLLHPDAVEVLINELLPLAALVTPNTPEAALLLSRGGAEVPGEIADIEGMRDAATRLGALGPRAVLVKGGHVVLTHADVRQFSNVHPEIALVQEGFLGENMEILQVNEPDLGSRAVVVDVLWNQGDIMLFVSPRVESTSTHGTGCTLSAAIAAMLAKGNTCKSQLSDWGHWLMFPRQWLMRRRRLRPSLIWELRPHSLLGEDMVL